jgi:hypothetical protein
VLLFFVCQPQKKTIKDNKFIYYTKVSSTFSPCGDIWINSDLRLLPNVLIVLGQNRIFVQGIEKRDEAPEGGITKRTAEAGLKKTLACGIGSFSEIVLSAPSYM